MDIRNSGCSCSIEYADGSSEIVASDRTWKLTTDGPIRANNEYDGEEYDARMELDGWARARLCRCGMAVPRRSWQHLPDRCVRRWLDPIRVTETLTPVSVREIAPGTFIYDMGQNLVGWCRLFVQGPRGTTVTLRHAETLTPDGKLYVAQSPHARRRRISTRCVVRERKCTNHASRITASVTWK